MQHHKNALRIFYLTGPADISSDYDTWAQKSNNASSFGGGVFMEQFFQFCEDADAQAYLVSTASGSPSNRGRFILDYRNPHKRRFTGLAYHARMCVFLLRILISIFRFRPNLLLVAVPDRYWFMFYPLYFSKIIIVPFFHSTLWPRLRPFDELTLLQRTFFRLSGLFLKQRCHAVLAITDLIEPQLRQITGANGPRTVRYRPIYDRGMFDHISPPDWRHLPFRILFVGRVATEKGIYDLLKAAGLLRSRSYRDIVFDICGTGDDLSNLRDAIKRKGFDNFFLHGQCDRATLHAFYSQCHVVVVPTTRDFSEGFNRVTIEAVLCSRPVIVSTAALETEIADAALEVAPSDYEGLANAITKLREDEACYRKLQAAAVRLQESFYDKSFGWENGLREILKAQLSD